MKIKGYVASAVLLILIVYYIYWNQFSENLQHKALSIDPAVWGQFGDYIGGVLNPLLSFISIALLIKSLTLQNEANESLKRELKRNERTEKLRSFEVLFFNLLDAQKNLFSSFELRFPLPDFENRRLQRSQAVIEIESYIEKLRREHASNEDIAAYLERLDEDDQIFGIARAFYVVVSTISEKLSDANGFTSSDRMAHFRALVNFTDFSQLRLILISIQFLKYFSTAYLRASPDFTEVINELGLKHDQY